MTAAAFAEFGLEGAAAALVACPTPQLRPVLQEMLRTEGVPHSELGGPFALDAPAAAVPTSSPPFPRTLSTSGSSSLGAAVSTAST